MSMSRSVSVLGESSHLVTECVCALARCRDVSCTYWSVVQDRVLEHVLSTVHGLTDIDRKKVLPLLASCIERSAP